MAVIMENCSVKKVVAEKKAEGEDWGGVEGEGKKRLWMEGRVGWERGFWMWGGTQVRLEAMRNPSLLPYQWACLSLGLTEPPVGRVFAGYKAKGKQTNVYPLAWPLKLSLSHCGVSLCARCSCSRHSCHFWQGFNWTRVREEGRV